MVVVVVVVLSCSRPRANDTCCNLFPSTKVSQKVSIKKTAIKRRRETLSKRRASSMTIHAPDLKSSSRETTTTKKTLHMQTTIIRWRFRRRERERERMASRGKRKKRFVFINTIIRGGERSR